MKTVICDKMNVVVFMISISIGQIKKLFKKQSFNCWLVIGCDKMTVFVTK